MTGLGSWLGPAPVTRDIIFVTVAAYVLQELLGPTVEVSFALWPLQSAPPGYPRFFVLQLVTYALLHANLLHLAVNVLGLMTFAPRVERRLGPRRTLALYGASVVAAALLQLIATNLAGTAHPTVGASGGVFGFMLAIGLMYPRRRLFFSLPPVTIRAGTLAFAYGVVELVQGVFGTAAGIAHFAHLGGMLGAYLVLRWWRLA